SHTGSEPERCSRWIPREGDVRGGGPLEEEDRRRGSSAGGDRYAYRRVRCGGRGGPAASAARPALDLAEAAVPTAGQGPSDFPRRSTRADAGRRGPTARRRPRPDRGGG